MKLVCALKDHSFTENNGLGVILYGYADRQTRGSAGAAIAEAIRKQHMLPAHRAWDFLSLALSVTSADLAGARDESPDGWTRQFELTVSVMDPEFWNSQRQLIARLLGFLTTDLWDISFIGGGFCPEPPKDPVYTGEACVLLLSGGLDSFIGAVDLTANQVRPLAVSQTVRGDAENQRAFAHLLGGGLRHLQLNHNTEIPNPENPPSQRARSLIFIAEGILAATSLKAYSDGAEIILYMAENGFISINPPLTGARLGSLSTRTTHPVFLQILQGLFYAAGIRVRIVNPYQFKTKGEMLRECLEQNVAHEYAHATTSCGRFKKYGYKHCGRCVPCLVRRASFLAAGYDDKTVYVYNELGRDEDNHAGFDDVRSVAMALAESKDMGLDSWIGTALSTALLGDISAYQNTVDRGLQELGILFDLHGVK